MAVPCAGDAEPETCATAPGCTECTDQVGCATSTGDCSRDVTEQLVCAAGGAEDQLRERVEKASLDGGSGGSQRQQQGGSVEL